MNLNLSDIIAHGSDFHLADKVLYGELKTLLHGHTDFLEFFLVREGVVMHDRNGTVEACPAGTLCITGPGDRHRFFRGNGVVRARFTNLAFFRERFESAIRGYPVESRDLLYQGATLRPTAGQCAALCEHLDRLHETTLPPGKTQVILTHCITSVVTLFLLTAPDTEAVAPALPPWLSAAMIAMRQPANLRGGLSRFGDLSRKSPEHLSRTVRRHLDTTPASLVNNLRLEAAACLLRETDRPVSHLCNEVGFTTATYFNRLFKKRFTLTPRQFRQLKRQPEVVP